LRSEWQAAEASIPNAIWVISWNEYSESTQVEPSVGLGTRYLDTLRQLTQAAPPPAKDLDSSAPQGAGSMTRAAITATAAVGSVVGITLVGVGRRRRLASLDPNPE
jgi:hypothetical protein